MNEMDLIKSLLTPSNDTYYYIGMIGLCLCALALCILGYIITIN